MNEAHGTAGIYTITHIENGNRYVGSAVNIARRWTEHKRRLNRGAHGNCYLQRVWDKYGSEAFLFEVAEYCSKEQLLNREQYFIDAWAEYNINPTAGSNLGRHHTDEAKSKMSVAAKGNTNCLGHKHTDESKSKMSAMKKQNMTPTIRAMIGAGKKGNAYALGHKRSPETRAKMSAWQIGRTLSRETCAKKSSAMKVYYANKREAA